MFKIKLVNMNICIIGYGKMGKAIEKIAIQKGHNITLKINSKNKDDLKIENTLNIDVAIEFSHPHSAFNNIQFCLQNNIPVVSGTTGWLNQIEKVKKTCIKYNSSFLYAPNFSLGVNLFFELNQRLAKITASQSCYDIKIEEIHHTQKKDNPSGTAIKLAETIIDHSRYKRWTVEESIEPNQINIKSKRKKNATGTHTVRYESEVDIIEINHSAKSRQGFGLGAVIAAEWLVGRKGVFSMKDVLKIQ